MPAMTPMAIVLREDQSGDLSTTSDDRTVVRTFGNNTTDWLLGFPTSETVYQGHRAQSPGGPIHVLL
jgi:hypothetical protein